MEDMYNTIKPIQDMLLSSISVLDIVKVLSSIVGVGMTFVLMWFGVRKLVSIFKNSVLYGKIVSSSNERWLKKQIKYSRKHYGYKG